jgi:hypothetical protein
MFQIPPPIIFSLIVYPIIGLPPVPGKKAVFVFFMILCQLSATSLALMVSTVCRTTDLSVTILPIGFELGRLFGG